MPLGLINRTLQHLTLWRKPIAFIDNLGILRNQCIAQVDHLAIHSDRFNASMRHVQNGPTGRFIDASRFHADVAILNKIESSNAMGPADCVYVSQQISG